MRWLFCSMVALLLAAACGGDVPAKAITEVEATDHARAQLPFFMERLAARSPDDASFSLVVRIPREGERPSATLQIDNVVVHDKSLRGSVRKPDANWPEFPAGAPITFGKDIVVDWSFLHKGQLIGGFRMRAQMCSLGEQLKDMKGRTAEAEALRAELAKLFDPATSCNPYDARAAVGAVK